MSKEYRKCVNPDCKRLAKRHKRCGICRRFGIYNCQDCKADLDTDRAILCKNCARLRHNELEYKYRKQYNYNYHHNPLRINGINPTITN